MTSTNTLIIEGIHECGKGFLVSADCLGKDFNTTITGQDVTISLPTYDPEGGSELREPTWINEPPDYTGWPQDWGHISFSQTDADGKKIPVNARVRQFRFAMQRDENSENFDNAQAVYHGLESWWNAATSWIEVLSGQPVTELGRAQKPVVLGQALRIWATAEEGDARHLSLVPPAITFSLPLRTNLPHDVFKRCLAQASGATQPPDEWLLIRDARALLLVGEGRRAVLDAGTASELALTKLLDRRLAATDIAVTQALLPKYQMLGQMSQLAAKLGINLPPRFQQVLIEPRNDAAHDGVQITPTIASAAIDAATQVVDLAYPRASYLQIATD